MQSSSKSQKKQGLNPASLIRVPIILPILLTGCMSSLSVQDLKSASSGASTGGMTVSDPLRGSSGSGSKQNKINQTAFTLVSLRNKARVMMSTDPGADSTVISEISNGVGDRASSVVVSSSDELSMGAAGVASNTMSGGMVTSSMSVELGFSSESPFQSGSGSTSGDGPGQFVFSMNDQGRVVFSVPCGEGDLNLLSADAGFNDGNTHLMAGVYDGSSDPVSAVMKLYVDGNPEATVTVLKSDLIAGRGCAPIPVLSSDNSLLPPLFSVSAIYDHALTQSQALADYTQLVSSEDVSSIGTVTSSSLPTYNCMGYPGMLGWDVRLFSSASCSQLGGNWIGNGECLMSGGGSFSAALSYMNALCDPSQVLPQDQVDYNIRLGFVGVFEACGGHVPGSGLDPIVAGSELAMWGPSSRIRLFTQDECTRLQGNWVPDGECIAQGGGSYSGMMGGLNSDPRCN